MSRGTSQSVAGVPPEEVERRLGEFCRVAYEHRVSPQVVYHPPQQLCPWPGCGYRIGGIRFQLETMGTPADYEHWFAAWWQGPGLAARCPGCSQYVLFSVRDKQCVPTPAGTDLAILPDDWYQRAYLVPQPGS
jgi:hypothetical protein